MHFRKLLSLTSTLLVLACLCLAQAEKSAADPEKEKAAKELDEKVVQMLDQVIGEASLLRLPSNKAIVYAMAADLYWKYDEKKSRDLFRNAASEILAYNVDFERERRDSTEMFGDFFDPSDPRGQVLPLVAKNDAELALELMVQTRPAALAESMLKASAPDARTDGNAGFSPENQRVRQEISLEQRFALLAADENPDRAIKMIKDSLSKGISNNVLQLLQKLHKKDEKKAAELAGDVVRKLVDTDFTRKNDELQVALSYLQFMARGSAPADAAPDAKSKAFRFSESQAKDLASKLASTFLQPSNSGMMAMALTRALPNLEKLVPEKAAMLKQRQADSQRALPTEYRNSIRMQRVWDPNSTPEELLAEIPKLANEYERTNGYMAVANKISQIDDDTRARKLIDQIPDEKARTRALEQFESNRISRAASAGKLEDARKMIGTLTNKRMQIQKLVSLAVTFHKKGTEPDLESAKSLMKNARALINETPEDEDEMNNLMEVVKGYATIDPDTAFRMFEPLIDQINDIVHATAILSKYNKRNRSFKKGEIILRSTGSSYDGVLLFRYLNQLQLLGKSDLGRMSSLADRFQRGDVRTLVKLVAVQGVLKDDKKPETPAPQMDFYANY